MSWKTVAQCYDCWRQENTNAQGKVRQPIVIRLKWPDNIDTCHSCDRHTIEGIYVRKELDD